MPEPSAGPPGTDRPASGGSRLDARERALELLYEADLKDRAVGEVIGALPVPADPFTAELIGLADRHGDEIDADLTRVARGWTLDRMPVVDRAILRLGVAELRWVADTPTAVVLNEAVELAKRFSTDDSSRFVNGVLGRLAAEYRDA